MFTKSVSCCSTWGVAHIIQSMLHQCQPKSHHHHIIEGSGAYYAQPPLWFQLQLQQQLQQQQQQQSSIRALPECSRASCQAPMNYIQLAAVLIIHCCCADYYLLLRFLRARNYDLDKAAKMWCDSLVWRKEHGVDTILDDFVFHEREQFLMAYPQVCAASSQQ